MSDTKEFIGGYTPEDIGKNGWRFLLETCVEEEREALKKAVVFMDDFYSRLPVGDKKDYSVSFNYTIKCKGCNRVMLVLRNVKQGKRWVYNKTENCWSIFRKSGCPKWKN